ncbi:hypothetical protein BpsS140_00030 [Bacillus phage vB_BpsS-140]|nr:hypothetical protein BpsS140_00030 [Bacillus phage vB_BpsS-140]
MTTISDGKVVISTELDESGVDKGLRGLQSKVDSISKSISSIGEGFMDVGKFATMAFAPLTGFFGGALTSGAMRLSGLEQLQILLSNTFRDTKDLEEAWSAIDRLTMGTPFMANDVGKQLTQLVQSGQSLEDAEITLGAVLDFSVGSGQLGSDGEIHQILMKAVRMGGFDQTIQDQLSFRGFRFAEHIGNVLGVEASVASEMLKDGSIPIEEALEYFNDAVINGSDGMNGQVVAFAGSSQKAGQTFTGAMMNMGAAISRLGATLWTEGGAWEYLKETIFTITDAIKRMGPALEPVAKAFGNAIALMLNSLKALVEWFFNLPLGVQQSVGALAGFLAIIGPVLLAVGGLLTSLRLLTPITTLFSTVWDKLSNIFKTASKRMPILSSLFRAIAKPVNLLRGAMTALGGVFGWIIAIVVAVVAIFQVFKDKFVELYNTNEDFRNKVDFIWNAIQTVISTVMGAIWTVVSTAWSWIMDIWSSGSGMISSVTEAVWSFIGDIIASILIATVDFVYSIVTALVAFWDRNGEQIMTTAQKYWGIVREFISSAISAIYNFVSQILDNIKTFWDKHGEQIMSTAEFIWSTIVGAIGAALTAIWNWVSDVISRVMAFWDEHGAKIMETTANIWNFVFTIISTVLGTIWTVVSTIIGWVVNFIAENMGVIQTVFSVVWSIIEWIVIDVWTSIKHVIDGALKVIMGIINFFASLFTGNWSDMWGAIWDIVTGVLEAIWGIINLIFVGKILKAGKFLFKSLTSVVSKGWTAIKGWFSSSGSAISSNISSVFNWISNIVKSVWGAVRTFISNTWTGIKNLYSAGSQYISNVISTRFNAIKNTISTLFNGAWNIIKSVWGWIKSIFSSTGTAIWNIVKQNFNGLKNSISTIMSNVKKTIEDKWNQAVQFLKNIDLWQIGKNIIDGLVRGINGAMESVKKAVQGVGNFIPDWLKKTLGIKSPSRVLRDQIGKWIPSGVAVGVEANMGTLEDAMDDVTQTLIPNVDTSWMNDSAPDMQSMLPVINRAISMDYDDESKFMKWLKGLTIEAKEITLNNREVGKAQFEVNHDLQNIKDKFKRRR